MVGTDALPPPDPVKAEPSAREYHCMRQLPDPKDVQPHSSPAAVVMFAAVVRISAVALWVSCRMPAKRVTRSMPAAAVPSPVIVVVPVMVTLRPVAVLRSVVDAEAISALCFVRLSSAATALATSERLLAFCAAAAAITASAAACAVLTGLFASLVLSTLA
jgi:hypothetical protein